MPPVLALGGAAVVSPCPDRPGKIAPRGGAMAIVRPKLAPTHKSHLSTSHAPSASSISRIAASLATSTVTERTCRRVRDTNRTAALRSLHERGLPLRFKRRAPWFVPCGSMSMRYQIPPRCRIGTRRTVMGILLFPSQTRSECCVVSIYDERPLLEGWAAPKHRFATQTARLPCSTTTSMMPAANIGCLVYALRNVGIIPCGRRSTSGEQAYHGLSGVGPLNIKPKAVR